MFYSSNLIHHICDCPVCLSKADEEQKMIVEAFKEVLSKAITMLKEMEKMNNDPPLP